MLPGMTAAEKPGTDETAQDRRVASTQRVGGKGGALLEPSVKGNMEELRMGRKQSRGLNTQCFRLRELCLCGLLNTGRPAAISNQTLGLRMPSTCEMNPLRARPHG